MRNYLMTYVPARKGWMKQYKGKTFAISCKQLGCPPGKEGSWQAANLWWESKQKEFDQLEAANAPPPPPPKTVVVEELERWLGHSIGTEGEAVSALAKFFMAAERGELTQEKTEALVGVERAKVFHDTVTALYTPPEPHRTIGYQADQWLSQLRAVVNVGEMSVGRYDSYGLHVRRFRDWMGADKPTDSVNSHTLDAYHAFLSAMIPTGEKAKDTVRMSMMTAKQFVSWMAERDLCRLPGNIRSRRLGFKQSKADKRIETFTVEEVRELVGKAKDQMRLYLLLMLNCGMYQNDIAELADDEVDWKAGTLTRPRSKTPGGQVTGYKLWPETFALLKQFRAKETVLNDRGGRRVLLTERGTPLVLARLEGEDYKRKDCIHTNYQNFCRSIGIKNRKPLKLLRKTASSKLGEHESYKFYAQYFLAQVPETTADASYVIPSPAEFSAALDWLRVELLGE